jgi:phosphomannomutase
MRPLIESTSGTRGIIGENLPPVIAMNMAAAFGSFVNKGTVIVGGDTRTSFEMLKSAVIAGLTSVGIDVIDIGKVATPTVQQMIKHYKAAGGIVVTASHNPVIWNGIKLMNSTGSFLDDEQYKEYFEIYKNNNNELATWDTLGKVKIDNTALEKHVDLILSIIDPEPIKQANLSIIVDPNNGAGCLANPILFEKLGVKYKIINSEPNGIFAHNPEPLKQNLGQLIEEMKNGKYDIGFAQDADADRLVILDETGHYIGEDYSLSFCIDYILSKDKSPDKKIVVNLSTSLIVAWLANKYDASISYTKIGEANVTQEIKRIKATVGGEGNGGVIFPKIGWGRDSLVGMVVALLHLADKKQSVSDIVSQYPKFAMLREKIKVSNKEEIKTCLDKIEKKYQDFDINKIDGVKVNLPNGWIHVRPSNTEPIIRIFIEHENQQEANKLLEEIKKEISN